MARCGIENTYVGPFLNPAHPHKVASQNYKCHFVARDVMLHHCNTTVALVK